MSGPKNLVSAPRFDARQYGLLSVAQTRYDEPDLHWRNGVIWQDICGAGSSTYDPFCLASGTGTTPASTNECRRREPRPNGSNTSGICPRRAGRSALASSAVCPARPKARWRKSAFCRERTIFS